LPIPGSIEALYQQIHNAKWGEEAWKDDDVFDATQPSTTTNNFTITTKARVCMVGDALQTYILGGQRSGINTVWVTADRIHQCNSMTAGQVLNNWNDSCRPWENIILGRIFEYILDSRYSRQQNMEYICPTSIGCWIATTQSASLINRDPYLHFKTIMEDSCKPAAEPISCSDIVKDL
jgi:HAD-hyrolase-like